MEPDNLQIFIEEASIEMPALRRGILNLGQPGAVCSQLEPLLETAKALRAGGSGCGIPDIEQSATDLENAFRDLAGGEWPINQVSTTYLLDHLAKVEESLLQNYITGGSVAEMDVSAFIDESFDSLQHTSNEVEPGEQVDDPDGLFGFEIDDELLEVFAMEAEGLLKGIESSLETLSANPQDRDALWEIRRNAHTFKGAAGIVGFKKPSELAHRVEDLLDRMAEKDFETSVPVFDVLRRSTDCLQAMTNGDTSVQLTRKIAEVYVEFDSVLNALANPPNSLPHSIKVPVESYVLGIPNVIEQDTVKAVPPAQDTKTPHRKRSIVRVSLERLDHLVRITRDLLIDRSVFEQRLRDLELQIDELHNATRRLQSTSGKLEIDFEAAMLNSPSNAFAIGGKYTGQTQVESARFDDLEFDRYTDFHQSTRQLSEAASDTVSIGNALDIVHGSFQMLFDHQRHLIEEMQEKLMSIRMVEFSSLATRLQRAVTVTCEEEQKKVRLTLINAQQELDTQILDSLAEPLMHLLKNAVVHGIELPETRRLLGKPETGEIVLSVANEETHVALKVSDDGRGIAVSALKQKAIETGRITQSDADAISESELCNLIFLPGLTTAEKLNLSAGRGVGMSIVKENLESQRGQISIASRPQEGTTFFIRMPLTLAVTNALLVRVGRQTLAIPIKLIRRILEMTSADITEKGSEHFVETESQSTQLRYLADLLAFPGRTDLEHDFTNALRIDLDGRSTLVAVDEVLRTEEIVIKPLGRPLENIHGILGAAILGNGELVPILDMPHLLNSTVSYSNRPAHAPQPREDTSVLIVDDSPSVRHMTSKIVASAGWIVATAKDGIDAIEILKSSKKRPDVILTDIEMPRMDGYEFVSTLSRMTEFAKIPVVMITSRAGAKHREKALETGVAEYLTKPFDDKELISVIERLAETAKK